MLHEYVLRLKQVDECLKKIVVMSCFIYIYSEVAQTKRPWQHVCIEHLTYQFKVPEPVCLREQLVVSSLRVGRRSFTRTAGTTANQQGCVMGAFKCNVQMTSHCEVASSGKSGNMRLCKTYFITK